VNYALTIGNNTSVQVTIAYLSDRPISEDARSLVIGDVQRRLDIPDAKVDLEYINQAIAEISFEDNSVTIPTSINAQLDQVGNLLQRYPNLKVNFSVSLRNLENESLRRGRIQAIASYLATKWQITPNRLSSLQINNIGQTSNSPLPANSTQEGKVNLRLAIVPNPL
jgi:outer membrane protein OmpA-like peptidoglycan-associated protein